MLNDMSEATIDVDVSDVFNSPKIMEQAKVTPDIVRALVVPKSFDLSHFLENVTRNRGHNLMIFNDLIEARRWLKDVRVN